MSKKYKLDKEDLKKIWTGALIAVSGSILVYAAEIIPEIDFGACTPLAVAIAAVLVNLGRKLLSDTR